MVHLVGEPALVKEVREAGLELYVWTVNKPADVKRLAEEIATRRIPAIFVESSIPRRTVEALQAAVRRPRYPHPA